MIDDFIHLFGGIIENSKNNAKIRSPSTKKVATWKHCVILAAAGWKAISFDRVNEEYSNDAIIRWSKEGKEDIEMRLPFKQQCLWLEYMERKDKEKK